MLRQFNQLYGIAGLGMALFFCCSAWGQAPASSAADALQTIFSPQRAPAKKTMGLLQRSFLDLVEESQDKLEVALVIDGTDSMSADIEGVRRTLKSMAEDLRRYRGDHVSFALVIYRDLGSPSGQVTIPLNQFTNDDEVIQQAFEKIAPETGAPYFYEAVDLGVQKALSELNWSTDETTTRWLLLFGDAPPYDAGFQDTVKKTGARRHYATDVLVDLAKRKGVQISCILCTSQPAQAAVYDQVIDKTRSFMNSLATDTKGLMLDLSYPDIRKALIESAKQPEMESEAIDMITKEEVQLAKEALVANTAPGPAGQRIRIAVLPHMPLAEISFDAEQEPVQIATELRLKLRNSPNTTVSSPVDVRREMRRLRSSSEDTEKWLQELALRLRVDYIVWGNYKRARGIVQVKSAVYTKENGRQLANAELTTGSAVPEIQLAGRLTEALALSAGRSSADPVLAANFSRLQENPDLRAAVLTPVAADTQQRSDVLIGLELLEQAMSYALGSPESKELLDKSEQHLTKFADENNKNALAQLLLSSCYFNLAAYYTQHGEAQKAAQSAQQYESALKRAYRQRTEMKYDNLRLEIEGDYALLIQKDYAQAIKLYEALANATEDSRLNSALRGHWMLAGVYSGDWGVPDGFRDADKARQHLVQILAHWGDSDEAKFIKTALRWDDENGESKFQHYPRRNKLVLAALMPKQMPNQ